MANALRVRQHLHARLDSAGAGWDEDARSLDLDDTDPADVDRGQVVEITECRRVDALSPTSVEDRRAGGHGNRSSVDCDLDPGPGRGRWRRRRTARAGCRFEDDL